MAAETAPQSCRTGGGGGGGGGYYGAGGGGGGAYRTMVATRATRLPKAAVVAAVHRTSSGVQSNLTCGPAGKPRATASSSSAGTKGVAEMRALEFSRACFERRRDCSIALRMRRRIVGSDCDRQCDRQRKWIETPSVILLHGHRANVYRPRGCEAAHGCRSRWCGRGGTRRLPWPGLRRHPSQSWRQTLRFCWRVG